MPLIHLAFLLSSCGTQVAPQIPIWRAGLSLDKSTQQQRIFVTPDLHDLIVLTGVETMPGTPPDNRLIPFKGSLHNDVIPTVHVGVSPQGEGPSGSRFVYEYTVANSAAAHDAISEVDIAMPPFAPGTQAVYLVNGLPSRGWFGSVASALVATQRELGEPAPGRDVFWLAEADGIMPGRTRTGFWAASSLMPGFTTAALEGDTYQPSDNMDAQIMSQLDALKLDNYTRVTTLTFGPMFLPGSNPVDVLANYRLGLKKLAQCSGVPHSAVFVGEITKLLDEPGIETQLNAKLGEMKNKPSTSIETELLNCLRIVASAFQNRAGGRN